MLSGLSFFMCHGISWIATSFTVLCNISFAFLGWMYCVSGLVSSSNGGLKDQTKRRWIASVIQPMSRQSCEESCAVSSVGGSQKNACGGFWGLPFRILSCQNNYRNYLAKAVWEIGVAAASLRCSAGLSYTRQTDHGRTACRATVAPW